MNTKDVTNKIKTISQGKYSESVVDKMGTTFVNLCKLGDFTSTPSKHVTKIEEKPAIIPTEPEEQKSIGDLARTKRSLGGLHYNIQIILPASRDPKVYDALFRSLKEHLID